MKATNQLIENLTNVKFKRKPKKPTSSFISKLNNHHITKQLSVGIANSELITEHITDHLSFILALDEYAEYDVVIAMILLAFIQANCLDQLNTLVNVLADDESLIFSSFIASSYTLNNQVNL